MAGCVSSIRFFSLATFTSVDGHFHIDVPGGTMTDQVMPSSGIFAGSTVHGLTRDADGLRFAVLYGDADPSYLASVSIETALATVEQGNVNSTKGTQTSDLPIIVDDQPAREQRIASPTASYRFHLVFVGRRLYSISVTGSGADIASAEATTYLGSFTVDP